MVTDVRVSFNVPAAAASFTGKAGVRWGVPFPEDALVGGDGILLVDAQGQPIVASAVKWTAAWHLPDWVGVNSIKFALCAAVIDIAAGRASDVFLRFGPGVPLSAPAVTSPQNGKAAEGDVTVMAGSTSLTIGPTAGMLGVFTLSTRTGGVTTAIPHSTPTEVIVEQTGALTVLRIDGAYVGDATHRATTWYHVYTGVPVVRITHTLTWNQNASRTIAGLSFARPVTGATSATYGFSPAGAPYPTAGKTSGRQVSASSTLWNAVETVAGTLSNWMTVTGSGTTCFFGFEGANEQYPAGFAYAAGTGSILLMGPVPGTYNSLANTDLAVPPLAAAIPDPANYEVSVPFGGGAAQSTDIAKVTPRGAEWTFETWLWFGDDAVPADVKIAVLEGVQAVVDPGWVAASDVVSPMRAPAPGVFPELEAAATRIVDFSTKLDRPLSERATRDGMLGWFYRGSYAWQFIGDGGAGDGYVTYRMQAIQGKGCGAMIQVQALRTGDPALIRFAKIAARFHADRGIVHVPEWGQYLDDADAPHAADWKARGATGSFGANAFTLGQQNGAGGGISFTEDSESLILEYWRTGCERIRRALIERVLNCKYTRWDTVALVTTYQENATILGSCGRDLYNKLRELCHLLDFAKHDPDLDVQAFLPTLKYQATATLSRVVYAIARAKQDLGAYWFGGITSPFYLDQALVAAARVLGSTAALDALDNWSAFLGTPRVPGYGGQAYGPTSIWSMAEAWKRAAAGDKQRIADEIDATLRGQCDQVLTVGTISGRDWTGFGALYTDDWGPLVRSMLAGAWVLAQQPGSDASARQPMGYFSSQLLVAGTTWRHVCFVKKPDTAALSINVHLHSGNSNAILGNEIPVTVRLHKPDLSIVTTGFSYLANFFHTWGLEYETVTLGAGTPAGIYALEIETVAPIGRGLPVRLSPSGPCQVSHYLPTGLGTRFVSIVAPSFSGEMWMTPNGAAPVRVQGTGTQTGRTLLLDAAGAVLAEAQMSGVSGSGAAEYAVCSASSPPTLARFVTASPVCDKIWTFDGARPYVASTRADLFDAYAEAPALVNALGLPVV